MRSNDRRWIRHLVVASTLLLANPLFSDILGSFEGTRLLPGYIDLSLKSKAAKNIVRPSRRNDGVERRTPSQILASYVDSDLFDEAKANRFIAEVQELQANAFYTYCSTKLPEEVSATHAFCHKIDFTKKKHDDEALAKMLKKWRKQEALLATDLAIAKMKKAIELGRNLNLKHINRPLALPFLEAFFGAMEAYESIKAEDADWGRAISNRKYLLNILAGFLSNHVITSRRPEAANIPIPPRLAARFPHQVFFAPEQLEQLEADGEDISRLHPLPSGFWRPPVANLSAYDPKTYGRAGLSSLKSRLDKQQIEDLLNPEKEISVTYKPSSPSNGTTPKIDIIYGDGQKWKMKFVTDKLGSSSPLSPTTAVRRLIMSSEVNIEPAVNNLAHMTGYTVDPTYFKVVVRLYMPEDVYRDNDFDRYLEEELLHPLKDRFDRSWNTRSAFEHIKTDKDGKKYIEMRSVTLEKKSDVKTDRNVSFFVRHGLGKSLKREFRAFGLFLALIQDPDVKDDNTKIKIIPGAADEEPKIAFAASDMGIALGFGFPNLYGKNLVQRLKRHRDGRPKKMKLDYYSLFPFPLIKTVSFADARWLMRLIAQIPERKIYESFRAAGYPRVVARYYREIFLRRCDQLYEGLNLLGETFVGTNGVPVTIKKRSKIIDPETFSLPSKKVTFNEGKLEDPENKLFDPKREHFPRDWGTAISNDVTGRHKDEFYKLLKKGLVLQGGNLVQRSLLENFQFSNIGARNRDPFCLERCFFSGLKFGVDWFVPMRFLLENPTDSSDKYPYWVVDMFRLAFTLGAGVDRILDRLGLSFTAGMVGLGKEFVKGWDFIKIRPVRDYSEALKKLGNNRGAGRKYVLKNIEAQVVDDMEPGDILIGSNYIGSAASIIGRNPNFFFVDPNAGVEAGVETYLTNRIYMMKGADNHLLANWADLKRINVYASAFAELLFLRVPIMKAEHLRKSANNRVFEFNLSDPDARASLLANINASHPDKVDPRYRHQSKVVKHRGWNLRLNLFGIAKWLKGGKKQEVEGSDFQTGKHVHELAYERSSNLNLLKHLEPHDRNHLKVRTQVSRDGHLFAKFDFRHYQNQAYRRDFLKAIKRHRSILPPDFITFDPKSVKYYIGNLEIESNVVFGPEAFETLFLDPKLDKHRLCKAYGTANEIRKNLDDWCSKVNSWRLVGQRKRQARSFLSQFAKAKSAYVQHANLLARKAVDILADSEIRSTIYDMLEKITNLLFENRRTKKVFDTIQSLISAEHIHRDVKMSSVLEGFPGLIDTIEVSSKYRGKLKLDDRYKHEDVGDAFKIFTDDIEEALNGRNLLNRSVIRD